MSQVCGGMENKMSFLEKMLYSIGWEMTRPGNYGWFHLLFVAIAISAIVFLCVKYKDADEKKIKKILLIAWIILMVGETVKQLIFSFDSDGITAVWDYQWYAFPYQLCGTPLVVLPVAAFSRKEGKIYNACIAYLLTFSLFGGLAVYFYPNDVFIETVLINLQTMIHHGLQVVIGIFLVVHNRKKLNYKYYIGAVVTFVILVVIALIMNIGVYNVFQANGIDETFNMFYISPYFECTLPVLSAIYPQVPYPVFLALYIFGFMIIAAILLYGAKGITYLTSKKKNANKE